MTKLLLFATAVSLFADAHFVNVFFSHHLLSFGQLEAHCVQIFVDGHFP